MLEEVDIIHKAIKYCASTEELDQIRNQEDTTIINYHLRIEHSVKWITENQDKCVKLLQDEKRITPLALL